MNEQEKYYNPELTEESVDYKALFLKFFRYWYYFLLSVVIALTIAYFFNKYTSPVYEVSGTMLINDPSRLDPQTMIGMGSYGRVQNNIQNEIAVLRSYAVINRTIKKLDFQVSYFSDASFMTTELYRNCPFRVVFDPSEPQPVGLEFRLVAGSDNTF